MPTTGTNFAVSSTHEMTIETQLSLKKMQLFKFSNAGILK